MLGFVEAHSTWLWDDETPILQERLTLHVFRKTDGGRVIDVTLRLEALVDDIRLGGRPEAGYSGFCVRMAAGTDQRIRPYIDPADAHPRRAWADYAAQVAGEPAGLTILQHPETPLYPSEWVQYPELNFFQPGFPGATEMLTLTKGEPLEVRFRLWVHGDAPDASQLTALWDAFARPGETYVFD